MLSASSVPSSWQAASASPLPRVEMVAVKGLNSHAATAAARAPPRAPSRRSSASISLPPVQQRCRH